MFSIMDADEEHISALASVAIMLTMPFEVQQSQELQCAKKLRMQWPCRYRIRGFFMPLNFHEFHELFWIREIKFVKCRNVIAILKFLVKTSVKMHGFVKF